MSDKKSRLSELEEAIRAASAFLPDNYRVWRPCQNCGEDSSMWCNAKYCQVCAQERAKEANRRAQQKRRRRDTRQRQEAAGLIKNPGFFSILQADCAHCGQPFKPERSTARYCGARCRVAAHRARSS